MFITECPRDAMQGWPEIIPTSKKIDYMNSLMDVGYDILDCGSFVNPRMVPQMADSGEVVDQIDRSRSNTKLSVVIANYRGAEKALEHENIDYLGFPFSISETFQHRNTNKSREEAFTEVLRIRDLTKSKSKDLILYFSMAFGNPYGEMWKWQDVEEWAQRFSEAGIKTIMLSDTTGVSDTETIALLFSKIPQLFPDIEFGAHFHNRYEDSYTKLKAAYDNGCRRFDTAIKGIGGCPMAKDELVGNMPTEQLINFLQVEKIDHKLNLLNFESSYNRAKDIFHF
ncbi:hydroxymethylglutaryl-CoA lyase [Elizabethkingia meningoseptica]|uniref:Hydroxymethylglutaryl-CoA lyase n=1 Tax=Elizabethkingia meningoseptica TaxID=238 RepID=A0A1V3TYU5_ELIME|nr:MULTISPECIES: hydroxymethylglutaryl-CoA lyase [Elizabethkingia]AQX04221.1 hydroxymethylglutaryl-CoA lyase [Elizabethkingia meningoseptica]AQX11681.1 hydroxymethylglutaryl-CoA lyase [Elizabethkingia meningoseptica]AQX46263.1 hydroxymethylglutaryl-CoA lyase [Elizabethkingia meningoseptica]EJK5330274.1 hydroxymethylglutaryl-CoA lyase [Elizabethkingia meningoseptica]EOR30779.1 Hydroxymethylglutaryl-CoA lyase [Elizabethkingia meningoseptica ATCC 13253 = NBRC 12535]